MYSWEKTESTAIISSALNKTLAFILFGYFAELLLTFAGRFLTLICHFDV